MHEAIILGITKSKGPLVILDYNYTIFYTLRNYL